MLSGLALLGVALAGIYFLGLAALAFIAPMQARRFLLGFAGSAAVHYLELLVRMAVGGAFVLRAPDEVSTRLQPRRLGSDHHERVSCQPC